MTRGRDLGTRFSVAICVLLFVLAGCGTAATRDEGTVPAAQPPTATSAPTSSVTASVTASPVAPIATPATSATQVPATAAPVTQGPATAAPITQAPSTRAPATVAPTAKPVGVVFTSVRSPVSRNGTGLVTISTAPNISCAITVTYKSGPS